MRYIIEDNEFCNLILAKKYAINLAKQLNSEVLITGLSATYKQTWYTVYPDGRIVTDGKNLSFNN